MFVSGLITLGAGTVALGAYILVFRPWHLCWGATEEEIARVMPEDEFMQHPAMVTNRAVTIRARPEEVWPWLVQLGAKRGGFYSYDWIERLGLPYARRFGHQHDRHLALFSCSLHLA